MIKDTQQKVKSRLISRRNFLSTSFKVSAVPFTAGLLPYLNAKAADKYNVVFMIVDDLRPMLGCYGISEMHTPNIDSLAGKGTLFNRAYCQYPLCNPSRASILTGLRPDTTKVHDNSSDYKVTIPDAVDMNQHFMKHGYNTYTIGKVKHYPAPFTHGPSWKALNVSDDELSDGKTAAQTENLLTKIKDQLFFLSVGFDKPHLPFHVPRTYYQLYDLNTFRLPVTSNYPNMAPTISENKIDLFRLYQDIPSGSEPISAEKTIELIRAYAASTSYMDAQVGRVLRQLDNLGLTEKTVVVFCGDHGFHLGEHGTWRKNTLFEIGVRSPLIINVPGQQPCQTNALVELVDIFPTLCDACELPTPTELEGVSLIPTIEQPTQPLKSAAFSYLTRSGAKSVSMRTDRYRYTEWGRDGKFGRELYDYNTDPHEKVNIVDLSEKAGIVEELSKRLRAGWKEATTNVHGRISIPDTLPWDINNDGIVDIEDLMLVSSSFGQETTEFPKVDVNKDGTVDIIDLLIVASHLGESCNASAPESNFTVSQDHIDSIAEWLTEAYRQDNGSNVFRDGIANLETLIDNKIPNKTHLLPNYPNPFNPETWIPYDLAKDTDVDITIYNLKGEIIRQLGIGFQIAGSYRTKGQAAYWDGRNSDGEPVSSGVYFYSLNTGQMKAIRQMAILK